MKKNTVADIVEETVYFLERTGYDKLAAHYLNFALAGFARDCEEQLAHYMVRYDVQPQRAEPETAQLVLVGEKSEDSDDPPVFNLDPYANLIGRADPETRSYPNIDLTAYDASVKISRRHAKIYSMDGRNYWIEDLGSFNGTILSGAPVSPRQPQPLHDGDELMFGNISTVFRSPAVSKPSII